MKYRRYYWLKLLEDFYRRREIKKIRATANGDKLVIVYQEILLLAMNKGGFIGYPDGEIAEELAIEINEDIAIVAQGLELYIKYGLAIKQENGLLFPESVDNVGSKTTQAEYMQNYRKNNNTIQNSYNVNSNSLHCKSNVSQCNYNVTPNSLQCKTDTDIDIDTDIEIDIDTDIEAEAEAERAATGKSAKWEPEAEPPTDEAEQEYFLLASQYPDIIKALHSKKCGTGFSKLTRVLKQLLGRYSQPVILYAINNYMGGVNKKSIDYLLFVLEKDGNKIIDIVARAEREKLQAL